MPQAPDASGAFGSGGYPALVTQWNKLEDAYHLFSHRRETELKAAITLCYGLPTLVRQQW